MPSKIRKKMTWLCSTPRYTSRVNFDLYTISDLNYTPGFMIPGGIDIKNIKEKANVMEDNISKRKHNHSIAAAILNFGREYPSVNFMFVS